MERETQVDGAPALAGARLLVVEDDALLLMELELVLAEAGAEVVGLCRSVADALRVIERGDLDGAILDFGLGQETAAPIADRLTAIGKPFCFYTGQVKTDPRLAPWKGCVILEKPAHPRVIVATQAGLLNS